MFAVATSNLLGQKCRSLTVNYTSRTNNRIIRLIRELLRSCFRKRVFSFLFFTEYVVSYKRKLFRVWRLLKWSYRKAKWPDLAHARNSVRFVRIFIVRCSNYFSSLEFTERDVGHYVVTRRSSYYITAIIIAILKNEYIRVRITYSVYWQYGFSRTFFPQ